MFVKSQNTENKINLKKNSRFATLGEINFNYGSAPVLSIKFSIMQGIKPLMLHSEQQILCRILFKEKESNRKPVKSCQRGSVRVISHKVHNNFRPPETNLFTLNTQQDVLTPIMIKT